MKGQNNVLNILCTHMHIKNERKQKCCTLPLKKMGGIFAQNEWEKLTIKHYDYDKWKINTLLKGLVWKFLRNS